MLSTILTSLQSLISARFIVSAFFPVLAFWFGNAAMLYWLHEPFRHFVNRTMTQTTFWQGSLAVSAAMIGAAITAYALSAVMPAIQSLLEGSWMAGLQSLF